VTAPAATAYDQYGQPRYGQAGYESSSYTASNNACQAAPELPAYANPRYVRTVREGAVLAPADEVYVERGSRRHVYYRHRRSTGKSVAIVAGSAGVGAAIGAIAGGGKGAGIGALAGGAGGFIYDRLTRH
jgi:hypothetical protein